MSQANGYGRACIRQLLAAFSNPRSRRDRRRCATTMPVLGWADAGDTTVAAAMLDRLLQGSVDSNLDGESYRLRDHQDFRCAPSETRWLALSM
jgi:DNA replication protein DnaC